jgi:hypothetical protein
MLACLLVFIGINHFTSCYYNNCLSNEKIFIAGKARQPTSFL